MAGIYIHVPFCKTRCIYCDFYSTTCSDQTDAFVESLCVELKERKDYLKGDAIDTIYFGGGTPSQLSADQFRKIFNAIECNYGPLHAKEITLEANPDDLTEAYVAQLAMLPFNRISMGIQTFNDDVLKLLKRRHNANQAVEAVTRCRKAGFKNISIDLIYGLPGETKESWAADLEKAISLNVEHISAYHLIYEEDTLLYKLRQEHKVEEVDEDNSLLFFEMLIDKLNAAGYEHYEISNFCKPGMYSRHNTSYWQSTPYLGCGPSAHSFNGNEREWNLPNLNNYIAQASQGTRPYEKEELSLIDRYNEFVITSLRTHWGLPLNRVKELFGDELYNYCIQMAKPHLANQKMTQTDNLLKLTRNGIFVSDDIMSDLLQVE